LASIVVRRSNQQVGTGIQQHQRKRSCDGSQQRLSAFRLLLVWCGPFHARHSTAHEKARHERGRRYCAEINQRYVWKIWRRPMRFA
jgi:hypothetical protein